MISDLDDATDESADIAVAHLRLTIIDLAGRNAQPMADDTGLTLSYNGEIYNYVELRTELEALGHRFVTTGIQKFCSPPGESGERTVSSVS